MMINLFNKILNLFGLKNKLIKYKFIEIRNYRTDIEIKRAKVARNYLSDFGVNLSKVRFIYSHMFLYDYQENVVNPDFDLLQPIVMSTGVVDKSIPVICVNKPVNTISVIVLRHEFNDEIINKINNSKNGVVISLDGEGELNNSVVDNMGGIYLADLDDFQLVLI